MPPLFETAADFRAGADVLRRRRYGVIEAAGGHFKRVLLRPFPRLVFLPQIFLGDYLHHRRLGDRCLLYYNQPWRFPNFLAVKYVISSRGTTYGTCRRVLEALDQIARLKGSDALLGEVTNWRISSGILERLGWEPHTRSRLRRNYIKRFYGQYPDLL